MADLTIAQIAAKIPEGDSVKDWWEAAEAIPVDTELNEFLAKTLRAAYLAAVEYNSTAAAGSRIDGYPAPTNGAVTFDPTSGISSYVVTSSIRTRVPTSLDAAISPMV